MLVEKKMSEALKDFDKGRKVLVLSALVNGSMSCDKLENLFPEDTHFLVDVPAYEVPEFKQAAERMVQADKKEEADESPAPLMKAGR